MGRINYRDFRRKPAGLASGWEDKVAQFLRDNNFNFTYEQETFLYDEHVYSGRCRSCGNERVVQERKYTPDFFIKNSDGSPFKVGGKPLIIEAKGYFDSAGRKQHRYLRDQYGERLDLRLCFMTNQVIKQMKKKPRYLDWAVEEGILACVGMPPTEWFKGIL